MVSLSSLYDNVCDCTYYNRVRGKFFFEIEKSVVLKFWQMV